MNKQQLARKIWNAANKLRNKIDANEYKDYILGLIFYKFLSDKEEQFLKENLGIEGKDLEELVEDPNNPDMVSVVEECQEGIGYFIEYKYLFNTWLKSSDFSVATLSDALRSFNRLMSDNYKAVYADIFNTLSAGLIKLGENPGAQTKAIKGIIKLIKDIPTDGSEDYDVLGYIYEYLIGNFAANAGKKAGEFYTPHEVAKVMSDIVAYHHRNKSSLEIYDPTSGSGSLLITIGKALGKHMTDTNHVKYYAQELKENTYNLTRMNLVMRGIMPGNIVTRCADTLEEDWPMVEKGTEISKPLAVDAVVSNPPYSQHWSVKDKEFDPRFREYGVAPKTKADYAFLLHELHHIKADGIMAIVMPHGVLFRGQSEGQIRSRLIEKNNIDAVIGLPAGIFFGTGIPTIIMVLKKNRGEEGILFIDASQGFVKDDKQNRLRAKDIKKITDTYKQRLTLPGYSREVSRGEIRENEYNLNIPRYVGRLTRNDSVDIYATMFGGVPESEIDELHVYWKAFPSLRDEIFIKENNKETFATHPDIRKVLEGNPEVQNFKNRFADAFSSLRALLKDRLIDHVAEVNELREAEILTSNVMDRCNDLPLIDKYDIYQIMSDHLPEVMGDIETIKSEGMGACNVIEPEYKFNKETGEDEETGEKGRIMPFALVQQELLPDSLANLEHLRNELDTASSELDDIFETLEEEEKGNWLNADNDKWDSKAINNSLRAIYEDLELKGNLAKKKEEFMNYKFEEYSSETKLQKIITLLEIEKNLKKEIKEKELQLIADTKKTIEELDMKRIVSLLMKKWVEPIVSKIDDLPDRIIGKIETELNDLNAKYSETLVDIDNNIKSAENSLADLINNLTGSDTDLAGLREFQKLLRHE